MAATLFVLKITGRPLRLFPERKENAAHSTGFLRDSNRFVVTRTAGIRQREVVAAGRMG